MMVQYRGTRVALPDAEPLRSAAVGKQKICFEELFERCEPLAQLGRGDAPGPDDHAVFPLHQ